MTLTSITNPLWIDSVAADKCNGVIGMTLCPGKKERRQKIRRASERSAWDK